MPKKISVVLPLATALAALGGSVTGTAPAEATTVVTAGKPVVDTSGTAEQWNRFIEASGDIFGFVVTENADGTVVAQHGSHHSHGSHGSHGSHASSRY
jgi:hypothetical protein